MNAWHGTRQMAAALALAMLPLTGLPKEDAKAMTRPTLTLTAPHSILVGEAFATTITATNATGAPISTVSTDSTESVAHRLVPVRSLPVRRLIAATAEGAALADAGDERTPPGPDDDDGGPPGADDDDDTVDAQTTEARAPDEESSYFVLSTRQKLQALATDDRIPAPPVKMVDLAPGAALEYASWPSDLMVEPIPAGRYNLTGILAGPVPPFETRPQPLEIRTLHADAMVACTHVGGAAEMIAYAHREADGSHTIYQHATGPGARMGPGFARGRASTAASLAQTCGGEPMRLGPFWVAWIEAGVLHATIAENQFVYGSVEALLDLPGASLAPLGWQDGNDAIFLVLGKGGSAALVSVSLDGKGVPRTARLAFDLPGEVLHWRARRAEAGGLVVVAAVAVAGQTRVVAVSVNADFTAVTGLRELLTTPHSLVAIFVDSNGDAASGAYVLLGPVRGLTGRPEPAMIVTRLSLDNDAKPFEALFTLPRDAGARLMLAVGDRGPVVVSRSGTKLLALRDGPPVVLTEHLADPSAIELHVVDGRVSALVADPQWGLVFLPAE